MNNLRDVQNTQFGGGRGYYPHRAPSVEALIADYQPTEPLYCLYRNGLRKAARRFLKGFPGKTLYAVKANPHPDVIRTLYQAGIKNFDTASLREVQLVKEVAPDATCYFMAICKLVGAAETAFYQYGVRDFVADHLSELERLLAFATPETTIHIRLKAFDPASLFELSSKFGAETDEAVSLLKRVAASGCRVGVAFNVGSLCRHPDAYRRAIRAALSVIQTAGVKVVSLDMGGGFPVRYPGIETAAVEEFFAAIRDETGDVGFPADCELLCEPGRALVAEGQSLLTQVILIKDDLVFLNDGVYGGMKEPEMSKGSVAFPPSVYRLGETSLLHAMEQTRPFFLSGPTCDSADVLPNKVELPADLRIGDWIEFKLSGAYSNAMATRFNGLYPDHWVSIGESQND